MNKKGFTLIELLAVIVILGVILVIAIPSISAAILNSRKNAYVTTANEFVDGARLITLNDPSKLPSTGTSIIPITNIKLEKGSSTKSPFGKTYTSDSGVYITYDATNQDYIYSIYLMDDGGNGIGSKTVNGGNTTINPVEIKMVTKDLVAVGESIPEQEPEPEPEPEPTYVTNGMLVWLDGINNLGTGDANHSTTTTTWKDLSGNDYSPTFASGGTLAWNSNNFNFNSTLETKFIFSTSFPHFQTGSWTVEARINRQSNSTQDKILAEASFSGGYQMFQIYFDPSYNKLIVYDGQYGLSDTKYYSSFDVSVGISTNITVTYIAGTLKFYKDGVYTNTINVNLSYTNTSPQ